jgi:prolyl-tRNA synthetase
VGAEPGCASPVGLRDVLVVADDAVALSPNLVAGANEEGFHLLNVNHGGDFEADVVADLAAAEQGSACPKCGAPMRAERGVEVGNIFKLGTGYAEAFGAYFLDRDGTRKPVVIGSYGIGVGRLLACIAEEHRDEDGLVWPVSIAPYHVQLVASDHEAAPGLCEGLVSAGVEVLYDDRRESLGTKFKDADLIGAPVRLTLTPRSLDNGGVEMKLRRERDSRIVPVDEAGRVVQQRLSELEAELSGTDSRR